MTLEQLINENVSKKYGIAIIGALTLWKAGAPSWQIMVVIITAIVSQAILDYKNVRKETKKIDVDRAA